MTRMGGGFFFKKGYQKYGVAIKFEGICLSLVSIWL